MTHFGCQVTPPPKGHHSRSLSLPSFLKSDYLVGKVNEKAMFQLTSNDTESLEVYPKAGNVKTIAEYLHQTDDSLLVLFPARQRLERSIAK